MNLSEELLFMYEELTLSDELKLLSYEIKNTNIEVGTLLAFKNRFLKRIELDAKLKSKLKPRLQQLDRLLRLRV